MKIQPYVEKLMSSSEYKKFTEEYEDAFMVAGFFILDFETGKNLHQIDYYVPSKKKVAAFTLDEEINLQMLDTMSEKIPEKLDMKTNVDLDELQGILQDEMKNRGMTEKIIKIIAVLQKIGGKKIWNLNSILSGMNLLRCHVEDESKTVLKMDKASMMELMKNTPGGGGAGPQKMSKDPQTKEEAEKQIEKLEELEKAIEKEKEQLKKKGDNPPPEPTPPPGQPEPTPQPSPEPTPTPNPEPEPTEPQPEPESRPDPEQN